MCAHNFRSTALNWIILFDLCFLLSAQGLFVEKKTEIKKIFLLQSVFMSQKKK